MAIEGFQDVPVGESGRIRALSLMSGGLDSQLAVCVLKDQGIDVECVVFESPFFNAAPARTAAGSLSVPLHVVDFAADIIGLLNKPKHGFGSCMNPCVDCHALMLKRAGEMAVTMGFHFLSTGEVLNERPMSQNPRSLATVARESGYEHWIVRPLSAGLLPETAPERKKWVDRSRLLSIDGRNRKAQFQLAKNYGLVDTPTPAGGCLLTDPNFCRRLRDLKDHEGLQGVRVLSLLRIGRHFRLSPQVKLIVGRNEKDNAILEGTAELYDLLLNVEDARGPIGLMPMTSGPEHVRMAAAICARYSDGMAGRTARVRVRSARGVDMMETASAGIDEVEAMRI